jgi:hypothetical protein
MSKYVQNFSRFRCYCFFFFSITGDALFLALAGNFFFSPSPETSSRAGEIFSFLPP